MRVVDCLLQISFTNQFVFFFYIADGNDISTYKHTKHEYFFKLKRLKTSKEIEKNKCQEQFYLKLVV